MCVSTVAEEMRAARHRHPHPHRDRAIEKAGRGFTAHTTARRASISADLVMYATGRKPNIANMGLEEVGVTLQAERRASWSMRWSRTSVPSIYAIGDVTDRLNLTPVAIAEGRAIAETLFNHNPIEIDHANVATRGVQPAAGRRRSA